MPKKPPKDPPLVDFIEEKVALYGELFGLRNYKIKIKWRTQDDDSYADCIAVPEQRRATLSFDIDNLKDLTLKEVEATVRHELFHILTAPMSTALHSLWPKDLGNDWPNAVEEQVVEDLSRMPLWDMLE